MQIRPVSGPVLATNPTPTITPTMQRAIAIAAGQAPVNQNHVAPEALGSIQTAETRQATEETSELDVSTEVEATETVAAAPASEEPAEKPSAQQLALARRERAIRAKAIQQEQAFKAREAALVAKEAELTAKGNTYNTGYISKDQLKANPLLALQDAGLSYDDVVQAALNQQPSDPRMDAMVKRLEAKIASLEEANENTSKSMTAQQQAAYDSAVAQIKADTKKLVFTDPNFETIKATNSVNDVVELIEAKYKEDGTLLSVEEAAQMVEDYLVEEAMKITKIAKIQRRLGGSAQPTQAAKTQSPQPKSMQPQPQMKTLTNSNSSTRPLSARERAILAARGELKS